MFSSCYRVEAVPKFWGLGFRVSGLGRRLLGLRVKVLRPPFGKVLAFASIPGLNLERPILRHDHGIQCYFGF